MRQELLHLMARQVMETLSAKLKELRRKRGWSQEDLARQINVSLSTIQRWEARGVRPTRLARRELQRIFQEAGINWELKKED